MMIYQVIFVVFLSLASTRYVLGEGFVPTSRLSITANPPMNTAYAWMTLTALPNTTMADGTLHGRPADDYSAMSWSKEWISFGAPDGTKLVTNPSVFVSTAVPLLDVFAGADDNEVYALFQKDDTGAFYDWLKVSNISLPSHSGFTPDAIQAISTELFGTHVFAQITRVKDGMVGIYWTRCAKRICTDWAPVSDYVFPVDSISTSFKVHTSKMKETNGLIQLWISTDKGISYNTQQSDGTFDKSWPVLPGTGDDISVFHAPQVIQIGKMFRVFTVSKDLKSFMSTTQTCNGNNCTWGESVLAINASTKIGSAVADPENPHPIQFIDHKAVLLTAGILGTYSDVHIAQADMMSPTSWIAFVLEFEALPAANQLGLYKNETLDTQVMAAVSYNAPSGDIISSALK